MLVHRLQEPGGAAEEGLALAPVPAQLLEPLRLQPALLTGDPQIEAISGVGRVQLGELVGEDHTLGGARRVQVNHVAQLSAGAKISQHAHDRRDPAARADEQQARG